MVALPNDFRSVLKLQYRYIDYKGNNSNMDLNCNTVTLDAISLLTEYEIFGTRKYANQYEWYYQNQMTYYANGNTSRKYRHNVTGTSVN